jgi:UDP-N-acetylmuramyl pentapeptide phosphotransferase/UDP-N-acetylglucosamine-1-phosphate transferase
MIYIFAAISLLILTFFLIRFCNKYHILENYSGDKHQKYTSSQHTPLIGGIICLLFIFFFINLEFVIKLFLASIFIVGILSDFKILLSPTKRLILQFIIIIFFLYTLDIHLVSTKLLFLDVILKNTVFSLFFTAFCLLVLINGTNFVDGTNGNVLIYYLIISILIFILKTNEFQTISVKNIFLVIELILILLIFNYSNKLYLGDSGSFLFGSLFGLILVQLYQENITKLSSLFIVHVLWYPAFENLFSILRKFYFLKSPTQADNNHLHQLLYFFLIKKTSLNKILINNSVSVIINFYNFVVIFLAFTKHHHTQMLVSLILFNIIFYILAYLSLFRFKKNYSKK